MGTEIEILEAGVLGSIEELRGTRYKVRLIEGDRLGSSGYYPAEVIKRDGPRIFKKGTPMYLDHQTVEEKAVRPFGTIDSYAGELAEDAYYENDGLYAEVEVFEHQAPKIKALKDKIGISIRAVGTAEVQTINGVQTKVFQTLDKARSADYVVRAGAGGKIVSILESAEEDSERPSEAQENESETMEKELIEALESLKSTVIEAVKPAKEETEEAEKVVDYDKVLEIAEELSASSLDAEGRARVLDLHRANGKALKELIAAEEAYVKTRKPADSEESAVDEEEEVEESANGKPAERKTPRAWKIGK